MTHREPFKVFSLRLTAQEKEFIANESHRQSKNRCAFISQNDIIRGAIQKLRKETDYDLV